MNAISAGRSGDVSAIIHQQARYRPTGQRRALLTQRKQNTRRQTLFSQLN